MVRKLQLWPNVYPLQANSIAHHDCLLLGLEVVEEDRALLRLLTPILDDNARAVDNLACVSLTVQHTYNRSEAVHWSSVEGQLTQTSPLAQLLSVGDLDQGDLVLRAERNHQLLVCLLLASLVQDAHVCLASVESLGRFAQTTGKTVVHERKLEDALEGIENGHLSLGCSISGNLDLIGLSDLGDGGGGFFVRLRGLKSVHHPAFWSEMRVALGAGARGKIWGN